MWQGIVSTSRSLHLTLMSHLSTKELKVIFIVEVGGGQSSVSSHHPFQVGWADFIAGWGF